MDLASRLNLNLLVALEALLAEGSVSGAAARLGVTQSAMSHSLRKLRDMFGDELLVRGTAGWLLTPRATQIQPVLRDSLRQLALLVQAARPFEPGTSTRAFVIAMDDYNAQCLLPSLVARLARDAPGITVDIRPLAHARLAAALEAGDIDLGLRYVSPTSPLGTGGLRVRPLFDDGFACVARRDHPAIPGVLDLDTYMALPHLLVSTRGAGPSVVGKVLAERYPGRERHVALRVPFFLLATDIVRGTDMILTLPRRLAEGFAHGHDLQVLEPPLDLPRFQVAAIWHERMDGDPGHRWLRGLLAALAV